MPRIADAQAPQRVVITLQTVTSDANSELVGHVEDHLRAELAARGMLLATSLDEPSLATVRIRLEIVDEEDGAQVALIQLGDAVTDKRVERSLDLRDVPIDARALMLAACVDELLRASWSELVLTVPPEAPRKAPPPTVARPAATTGLAVAPPSVPPDPARLELGASGVVEAFTAQTNYGGRAIVSVALARGWRVAMLFGVGETLQRSSPRGQVKAGYRELAFTLSRSVWTPLQYLDLRLETGLIGQWITYQPRATESSNTEALAASDWSALGSAGPVVHVSLGSWYSQLGVAGLLTIRPASATDTGTPVMSNRGAGAAVHFGIGARL